jgi:hypothetical protein
MKQDLTAMFKGELGRNLADQNIVGIDAGKVKNEFKETKDSKYKPLSYLKKGSSLVEILELVKNKKLSKNKIKTEIKKHLKEPDTLNEFLNSLLDSRTKKEESKEATGTGGGVGAYEAPLFGKKIETKEATSTASSGAYETPKMWAKSLNKKDWGTRRKTQIPGGKFVQVKKKCKRFPYCNQGDINALNLSENKDLQIAIQNTSIKYGISEETIVKIILQEFKTNKNN